MMKRIRVILAMVISALAISTSGLSVSAAESNVAQIKARGQVNAEHIQKAKDAAQSCYAQVVTFIAGENDQFLSSTGYTKDQLLGARLSDPIPIFGTPMLKKGDDYKTKLEFGGWRFIAYIGDKPLTAFYLDAKCDFAGIMNQGNAYEFDNALKQLGTTDVIDILGGINSYLADSSDRVASTKMSGIGAYPLVSFDEFNTAVNAAVDYNYATGNVGKAGGGGDFVKFLYYPDSPDVAPWIKDARDVNAQNNLGLILTLTGTGILVLFGVAFLAMRKIRAR